MLAPREQVLLALRGDDEADRVVLTADGARTPASDIERRLRNHGMCLVVEGPPLFRTESKGVKEERILLHGDNGELIEQRRVHTPAGELNSVVRHSADLRESRTVKRLFQKPANYAALVAMIEAQRFAPQGEEYSACAERLGADVIVRPQLGSTPMLTIMHELMGVEVFAEEWAHRRQDIVALYKALLENRRRMFAVVAESPAMLATYGGNLNARELGEERFNRYFLPAYHEFAEMMHSKGKLAGLHIHGDPAPLVQGLGRSHADYIEGFWPTGDFGIHDARKAWPDAAIWAEAPPDLHHAPEEDRIRWISNVLKRGRGERVLLEVAATMPAEAYRKTLLAVVGAAEESMKGKPLPTTPSPGGAP